MLTSTFIKHVFFYTYRGAEILCVQIKYPGEQTNVSIFFIMLWFEMSMALDQIIVQNDHYLEPFPFSFVS